MGGGISRINSAPHPEPTILDRMVESFSPRSTSPLPPSSPPGGKGSPQKQKPREIQVRTRVFSDPLIKYLPQTKKDDNDKEITIATTSRQTGDDGSNSTIQRDNSQNNNTNTTTSNNTTNNAGGMKYIFSSMHSLPSYLSPNHQITNDTLQPNNNITNYEFKSNIVDSIKLRERNYWLDGNKHNSNNTLTRHHSWNEIHMSSILSKPFSGNTKIMLNKSKNKGKNIKIVAVTSPITSK